MAQVTCIHEEAAPVVIEWLEFRVAAGFREEFVRIDERIWTAALMRYPGFIGKEVWLDPGADDRLVLVIRWHSRAQWKAIPEVELTMIQKEFDLAVGDRAHTLVKSAEFQIRKFCDRGE
ncbi:MAG: TIGR03792 family protein [Cyanobacteria bacterium J06641_5]